MSPRKARTEAAAEDTSFNTDTMATDPNAEPTAQNGERRKWTPAPDPFAIVTINAGENALHLGKSDKLRAYLIRFDQNPNDGREKEDPHPVLALLKENGYAYRQAGDGGMAWKKSWESGNYSYAEEQQAREFARKVAETLGPIQEHGASR